MAWLRPHCATAEAPPEPAGLPPPISFELDVQPVLTAAGCNAGACHGKQRGQNGFQLSLLAFDPDFDFEAIVSHARGRRVFPGSPQASLLLKKATAELPHGGGKRFDRDSQAYETLSAWLQQGAPRACSDEASLVSVELREQAFRLAAGESQPLQVTAHYSDQSSRDVTHLASYLSNDAAIVSVSPEGLISAGELPGETAIMVRYMNHIQVAEAIIPFSQDNEK